MRELTTRQHAVLDAIKAHLRRHGVPPSRTELAHSLGLSEASSVTGHLEASDRSQAGSRDCQANTNRTIRVLDEDVPLLGALAEVAAGTPIVCDSHIIERVPGSIAEPLPAETRLPAHRARRQHGKGRHQSGRHHLPCTGPPKRRADRSWSRVSATR